jgi:hypothetical protein
LHFGRLKLVSDGSHQARSPGHDRSGRCSKTQTASSPDLKEVMLRQSPPISYFRILLKGRAATRESRCTITGNARVLTPLPLLARGREIAASFLSSLNRGIAHTTSFLCMLGDSNCIVGRSHVRPKSIRINLGKLRSEKEDLRGIINP